MKKIYLLIVILMFSTVSVNAQLKTYKGDYPFWSGSKATYTYYDNPEGGRIYSGNFELYADLVGPKPGYLKGNFVEDKQDGKWEIFEPILKDSYLSVVFKNGVLNGPVYYKAELKPSTNSYIIVTFAMKDGMANGEYDCKYYFQGKMMKSISGSLRNNVPEGKWIKKIMEEENVFETIYNFIGEPDKEPTSCEIKEIDPRTGDIKKKVEKHIRIFPNLPLYFQSNNENEDVLDLMDKLIMRSSSPRIKGLKEISNEETKTSELNAGNNGVYSTVDEPAEFPGGQVAMMKWINNNLRYPATSQENNVQGRVMVKFIVEKDGSVSNPVIERGVDKDIDAEALRLVKRMPKLQPAKNSGKSVRSYFTIPITFKL